MMVREISVMDEDWDYLLILDACRYDYFSMCYRSYLKGKLEKVWSLGSTTDEWCKKSFTGYYNDIVYISANPIINFRTEVGNFDARKHFSRVIDVWDSGWDERLGTVHPLQVNKAVGRLRDKHPEDRLIIHFIQPHDPYLILNSLSGFLRPGSNISRGPKTSWNKLKSRVVDKGIRSLAYVADKVGLARPRGHVGRHRALRWRIREFLNLPPETYMDGVRRRFGDAGLRYAYKENLEIALRHAAILVENLSGTIVVTSDHGELLGENGCYLHFRGSQDPILREIPWLKIQLGERKMREEKAHIVRQLKRLKSLDLI